MILESKNQCSIQLHPIIFSEMNLPCQVLQQTITSFAAVGAELFYRLLGSRDF